MMKFATALLKKNTKKRLSSTVNASCILLGLIHRLVTDTL